MEKSPISFCSCFSEEDLLLGNSNDKSFTAKSFYGRGSFPTPKPRAKLPFYLRYSLGDLTAGSNTENDIEKSLLSDVTNTPRETSSPPTPEGHWKVDVTTPPSVSPAHPEGSRLTSGVQQRKPCYYVDPSERSPKKFVRSASVSKLTSRTDFIRSALVKNIGVVMPHTPSSVSEANVSPPVAGAGGGGGGGGGGGSERRFFKSRHSLNATSLSPTSVKRSRTGSATVVRPGFSLNFVPRRLSASFGKRRERKSRNSRPSQRKRPSCSNNQVDEEQLLPPLSNIFPELELEALPSPTTLRPLATGECNLSRNTGDQFDSQLLSPTKDIYASYSNSCEGTSSSPMVLDSSNSNSSESSNVTEKPRLFPIFSHRKNMLQQATLRAASETSILLPRFIKTSADANQMTLDAGQKKFGAIQCPQCGMVYTRADPMDETTHARFHYSVLTTLKFMGWKKERVVHEYSDTGSRIILVLPDDPKYAIRKVEDINQMMGQELGFPDSTISFQYNYKVFLYISEVKRIEGCCIAEEIKEGFRIVSNSSPSKQNESQVKQGSRPCSCLTEPEPCPVGISKIWVYGPSRRTGIASKLLDCARYWFQYGMLVPKNKLAFSDPTPEGMLLASKYTGSPSFLVYKCRTN